MKNYMVPLSALSAFVVGCSGAATPQCGDAATQERVKSAFWDGAQRLTVAQGVTQARFAEARKSFDVSLESVRPSEEEKGIAKVTCEASMTVKIKPEALPKLSQGFKPSNTSDVQYTAQLTSDGKTLVETGKFQNPTMFIATLLSMGALK